MTTFAERLTAPLSWWLSAAFFGVVWGWILLVATNWPIAITVGVTVAAIGLGTVARYGSVRIAVGDTGLAVGRATLDSPHIGSIAVLNRAEYRRRLGIDADARAYLVTRPYLDRGVLVTVEDTQDPAPYWLISSRHPEKLAAAMGHTEDAPGHVVDPASIREVSDGEED